MPPPRLRQTPPSASMVLRRRLQLPTDAITELGQLAGHGDAASSNRRWTRWLRIRHRGLRPLIVTALVYATGDGAIHACPVGGCATGASLVAPVGTYNPQPDAGTYGPTTLRIVASRIWVGSVAAAPPDGGFGAIQLFTQPRNGGTARLAADVGGSSPGCQLGGCFGRGLGVMDGGAFLTVHQFVHRPPVVRRLHVDYPVAFDALITTDAGYALTQLPRGGGVSGTTYYALQPNLADAGDAGEKDGDGGFISAFDIPSASTRRYYSGTHLSSLLTGDLVRSVVSGRRLSTYLPSGRHPGASRRRP